jgi:hypothetical protein
MCVQSYPQGGLLGAVAIGRGERGTRRDVGQFGCEEYERPRANPEAHGLILEGATGSRLGAAGNFPSPKPSVLATRSLVSFTYLHRGVAARVGIGKRRGSLPFERHRARGQ